MASARPPHRPRRPRTWGCHSPLALRLTPPQGRLSAGNNSSCHPGQPADAPQAPVHHCIQPSQGACRLAVIPSPDRLRLCR